MIPKIVHYCWFGRGPLPKLAVRCIESWERFFPDYEIKEWNEDNFDVNSIPYTREAYEAGRYAFVSDYARFWVLYHYGGVYFDTDVEVIKPMGDIIERGPFMGVEVPAREQESPKVAPGLGLGANPGLSLYKAVLDYYSSLSFYNPDGSQNLQTVVSHVTGILEAYGLKPVNEIQQVEGIWIYTMDYFNPLDSLTGKLTITENTRSIHWYMNSWSGSSRFYMWLSRMSHRVLGTSFHAAKERVLRLFKR